MGSLLSRWWSALSTLDDAGLVVIVVVVVAGGGVPVVIQVVTWIVNIGEVVVNVG